MNIQQETGAVSHQSAEGLHISKEGYLPAELASPPSDNMGVNNDSNGTRRGYTFQGVTTSGLPEQYFYRLALDTLQVSVKGVWLDKDGANRLLEKRRSAELNSVLGLIQDKVSAHDGQELKVFPHGARPSYQVLMRDGDGLEIRALPQGDMPAFIFRYGARLCVENSVADLESWTRAFVKYHGYLPEKVQLSEVHIRCDVPVPFTDSDIQRMRGTGTRNGRFNTHVHKRQLSGIDNLGGEKQIKFVIYNKRLEQEQKEGCFWPLVWQSYGIPADVPIWRVEARWDRDSLGEVGLDVMSDLTEQTIRGLWHSFTSRYLLFVSEDGKRADRTSVTRKWSKIQACGEMMAARPRAARIKLDGSRLFKQAAGCIAKAMATTGMLWTEDQVKFVVELAVNVADEKYNEQRRDYLDKTILEIIERAPEAATSSGKVIKNEIREAVKKARQKWISAKPFIQNKTTNQ